MNILKLSTKKLDKYFHIRKKFKIFHAKYLHIRKILKYFISDRVNQKYR